MPAREVADFIARYATRISAPVVSNTTVRHVRATSTGYEVVSDAGTWRCNTVVLATGACNRAVVPELAAGLPPALTQLTAMGYRGPGQLSDRGVLVVGGSATGVQLADEIARSGRTVTLAIGEHVRMPRRYRGRDIFWWLDRAGVLDQRYDEVDDITRARRVPSPQLVGSARHASIDVNALTAVGVRVVGRLVGIRDGVAQTSGALANHCKLADLKLNRLLDTFDDWAARTGLDGNVSAPTRPDPTRVPARPLLSVDLDRDEIGTVIWACGYRPDHSWLDLPVLDRRGRVRHDGGVVDGAPGVYSLGAPLLRRRRSSYISGTSHDTAELSHHLHCFLDRNSRSGCNTAAAANTRMKVTPLGERGPA